MARTKRKINPLVQEVGPAAPASKKYKAAAYVRLSVEDSGKPGVDTIEGQKALLTSFIDSKSDMELVSLFCDNGRTGTDFDRPQFEKMMEDVRKGRINCIVVKDLSRFGRNYKETGNYLERIFPFLGVRFIAVNDNFDTLFAERTQDGYIVPLKNLINEVYSKDISKKSASALHVKQQNGEFIGAWAPYGYRKDPDDKHHLVINEEVAPTVRQMFKWRSEGISVIQIARRLNDAGILSPSAYLYETGEVKTEKYKGVLWQTQIIKGILAHPVYIGHMVQGRKKQSFYEGKRQTYVDKENWIIVRNTHEPIIDEETFEKVQIIANRRKTEYHERLGKFSYLEHTENILQGLVWCPNCKRPMVRYKNVSHGQKLWYTYICPGHADDPARCSFVSIREDELNEVVFTAIQSQMQIAADLEDVIRRLNAEPEYRRQRSDTASKLEAAQRTLKRSQSLYDSLYQNYVEQLMTEQEYVTLKARYKEEAEKAEQLISALEQEQRESKVYTAENRFLTEFRSFMGTDTLTKEMASALVERIYVDADKAIDIRLRYRDEYIALLNFIEGRAAV
jgi:site-specific DNA recombinase